MPNFDKFSNSIAKTKQQTDKAAASMGTLYDKIKNIAGKAVSIPVKVIDYATSPLRKLYNFATSLKGVLTGLAIGKTFSTAVSAPLNLADQYSSAKIGFETLFQSAEKAQKMMNDIDQFAIETPFNTSNVISNIQKMMAYGWDANRLLTDMRTIGNAAAATGKGDEGLGSIVYALSEIRSKGKLSTQELNQLASAGIKAKQYLAEGLGFGSDDAGMMKLSEALEDGAIGANQAIDLILEGMKEFDGMMDKTANETVSGLKSQLADMFEVNIARRWGQGLQDGAKRGLGTLASFLDENRDKLSAFGDTLYNIGVDVSNFAADRLQIAIEKLGEITSSKEFQEADLFGKAGILWDKIIAEPFDEWWNGEGGTAFKAKAAALGESIGESIATGAMNVLSKVFGQIVPNLLNNAKKLFPGGEGADGAAWLSGAALLYGGSKLGLGKLAGWGAGKVASAAAGASIGVSAAGASGAAGFVAGAVGLVGAVNDLVYATEQKNEKEKRDAYTKGATKAGMVAAGTALGAAVGSVIPGLGTLIGAGLGAGLGGIGSLLFGGSLGQTISDWADGSKAIRDLGNNAEAAATKLKTAISDAKNFDSLVGEYKEIKLAWDIINESDVETEERLVKINEMIDEANKKKAEIEIKLTSGSLTKEERDDLLLMWGLEDEKTIVLNAAIGNGINPNDREMIDSLKQMYSEAGDELHLKALNFVIDSVDNKAVYDEIAKLEQEEASILTKLQDPLATEAQKTAWENRLKEIESKQIDLEAKIKPVSVEDATSLLRDLEDGDFLKLAVEATISNFSNKEEFEKALAEISSAVATASGGMISEWELMYDPLDKVIGKLERISELKKEQIQQSRVELATILAEGAATHGETGEKINAAGISMQDAADKQAAYMKAAGDLSALQSEYNLLTSELDNGLIADADYFNKLLELEKKYKDALVLAGFENWEEHHPYTYMSEMDFGKEISELYGDAAGYGKSYADYLKQKEEAQASYDQYARAAVDYEKTDYNKYGKTFDEWLSAIGAGAYSKENALDLTQFFDMISSIEKIQGENPYMSEDLKLNFANMAGQIASAIPAEMAKTFMGGAAIGDPQTFADYIYNAFVKARADAGGAAPSEGAITDANAALADMGLKVPTLSDAAKNGAATITESTATVATNLGTASTAAGNFASAANSAASRLSSIQSSSSGNSSGGSWLKRIFSANANGTITTGPEFSLIGEDGPEAVIPLGSKRRNRGIELWKQAGEMLGIRQYADGGIVGSKQYVDTEAVHGSQPVTVEVGGVKFEVVVQNGDSESVLSAIRENIHALSDEIAGEIGASLTKVYANMA